MYLKVCLHNTFKSGIPKIMSGLSYDYFLAETSEDLQILLIVCSEPKLWFRDEYKTSEIHDNRRINIKYTNT